jgi:hypothetical protein
VLLGFESRPKSKSNSNQGLSPLPMVLSNGLLPRVAHRDPQQPSHSLYPRSLFFDKGKICPHI